MAGHRMLPRPNPPSKNYIGKIIPAYSLRKWPLEGLLFDFYEKITY